MKLSLRYKEHFSAETDFQSLIILLQCFYFTTYNISRFYAVTLGSFTKHTIASNCNE